MPQGSVLGPVLHLLYTSDIADLEHNIIATFANDTAILAVGNSHDEATAKLQTTMNQIQIWTKKWRSKLNETKSVHINFTNKKANQCQLDSIMLRYLMPTQQNTGVLH